MSQSPKLEAVSDLLMSRTKTTGEIVRAIHKATAPKRRKIGKAVEVAIDAVIQPNRDALSFGQDPLQDLADQGMLDAALVREIVAEAIRRERGKSRRAIRNSSDGLSSWFPTLQTDLDNLTIRPNGAQR